jgi:hypothetical protein
LSSSRFVFAILVIVVGKVVELLLDFIALVLERLDVVVQLISQIFDLL